MGHLFRLKTEISNWLFGCYALRRFISLDEHGGLKASQGKVKYLSIINLAAAWCFTYYYNNVLLGKIV